MDNGKSSGKEVISAQQAEDLRMKEKRKREREVRNIPQFCCTYVFLFYGYIESLFVCTVIYLLDGNMFGVETFA